MRRILVDTGPLVAILSDRDSKHAVCTELLATFAPPLLTCWAVMTEAAWLLREQHNGIDRLLGLLNGEFLSILEMDGAAAKPLRAFLARYRSIGCQLADASLIYLAERENIDTIFTLDRRDFTIYRTAAGRHIHVVPD